MIHIHTLLTRLSSTHVHKFTRGRGGGQTETSRHLKTGWSNSTHTDVVTHLAKSHQARHNTTASARLRVWMSEEKCRQILWSKPPPSPKTLIIPFSISFYWLTFSITRRWGHPKEKKKKKVRAVTLSREHLENKSLRDGARDQRTHMVTQEVKYFQVDPDTKRGESLGGCGDSRDW